MTKTAVVILNWNGTAMLRRFLPSVIAASQSDNCEVIVADNASTDDSMKVMREEFPSVRTIVLEKNWGFATGYNKALQEVEAEYYVLLNSDVDVPEGWLDPLVTYMDTHKDVAAIQPKLLKYDISKEGDACRTTRFEYAGAAGGFIDRYGYPYCRGRIFDELEDDHGQYDTPMEVHWATGACLLVRSADYWAVGGLDDKFFAHCEEIDLCWRLRISGKKIMCIPDSKVYHVGGASLPKDNPFKTFLNFRNNLTMLYKNLPQRRLCTVMAVRFFLDMVAALQFLLSGKSGDAKAVIRARIYYIRWKKSFAEQRIAIQSQRQLPTTADTSSISLLWQYYVKGRKTWDIIVKQK